jgi:integrase
VTGQRGEVFKRHGWWRFRYYIAPGRRRERGGFRTKGEARQQLEEELRLLRTGRQPDVTLAELVERFLVEHDAAPRTIIRLTYLLGKATRVWGERMIREIQPAEIAAWRPTIPEGHRHETHAALRQVLAYGIRLKMLEDNPAAAIRNPAPKPTEFHAFQSWAEVEALAVELGEWGAIAILATGTGLRPEEWLALEWSDIDFRSRSLTVQRVYSGGRLTHWGKTIGSRRRVPLRRRVIDALEPIRRQGGLVFEAPRGGHLDLHNWRARDWKPALSAAGLPARRIYDMRHTYATFSLAAGVNLFTLARRMGTSVEMIDRTYGHLAPNADAYEADLLDAWDDENRADRCASGADPHREES